MFWGGHSDLIKSGARRVSDTHRRQVAASGSGRMVIAIGAGGCAADRRSSSGAYDKASATTVRGTGTHEVEIAPGDEVHGVHDQNRRTEHSGHSWSALAGGPSRPSVLRLRSKRSRNQRGCNSSVIESALRLGIHVVG